MNKANLQAQYQEYLYRNRKMNRFLFFSFIVFVCITPFVATTTLMDNEYPYFSNWLYYFVCCFFISGAFSVACSLFLHIRATEKYMQKADDYYHNFKDDVEYELINVVSGVNRLIQTRHVSGKNHKILHINVWRTGGSFHWASIYAACKDGEGYFPVKYHFMFCMEKDEMFSIDDIEIKILSISDMAEALTKKPDAFNKYFSSNFKVA